jgi:hypothetical protein
MTKFSFQQPHSGSSTYSKSKAPKPKSFAHLSLTDDSKRILIRSSYDQDFVDELKSSVPWSAREWHPKPDRFWTVEVDYLDVVEELCQRFYSEVKIMFEASGDCPFELMWLIPDTPLEICEAMHKILIKIYHEAGSDPDPTRWRSVNRAIKQIRKEQKL